MSQLSDRIGGFATIPNTVVKMIPQIGPDAFTLWCYLRYRTNGERGVAFPSYETIKADTGLHYRKVAAALRHLEGLSLLTRQKRFGSSSEYTLICPSPSTVVSTVLPPLLAQSFQRVQTNKTEPNKIENKKTEYIYAPPAEILTPPIPEPKEEDPKAELFTALIAEVADRGVSLTDRVRETAGELVDEFPDVRTHIAALEQVDKHASGGFNLKYYESCLRSIQAKKNIQRGVRPQGVSP